MNQSGAACIGSSAFWCNALKIAVHLGGSLLVTAGGSTARTVLLNSRYPPASRPLIQPFRLQQRMHHNPAASDKFQSKTFCTHCSLHLLHTLNSLNMLKNGSARLVHWPALQHQQQCTSMPAVLSSVLLVLWAVPPPMLEGQQQHLQPQHRVQLLNFAPCMAS